MEIAKLKMMGIRVIAEEVGKANIATWILMNVRPDRVMMGSAASINQEHLYVENVRLDSLVMVSVVQV